MPQLENRNEHSQGGGGVEILWWSSRCRCSKLGSQRLDEGQVILNDEDLTAVLIYERARVGISYLS